MASNSSTTISSIIILLISLADAQLSPMMNNNFGTCPRDPLQLGVCANVLNLANVIAGDTRAQMCCSAINGITDVQVADCLCYVFKPLPLVFGIEKAIREIFFACNRVFPIGFQCPPTTVMTPSNN